MDFAISVPILSVMNTPAHLVFAAAAFGSPDNPKRTWAAILGGLAPDFSLYAMTAWAIFISGHSPQYVFDTLYFSDPWQAVFSVDNSFFVWGVILALGVWLRTPLIWAFAAGALLHIGFDFPLHHDDGRAHFWPISDWVFESPVSYWDPNAFGNIVGPIEAALVVAACVWMWTRYHSTIARVLLGLAITLQIAPYIMFSLMMDGPN